MSAETVTNNCLRVSYNVESYFRCPYDLNEVAEWSVKWNMLYVRVKKDDKDEDVKQYEPVWEQEVDYKRPDVEEIGDEEDIYYEPQADDEYIDLTKEDLTKKQN